MSKLLQTSNRGLTRINMVLNACVLSTVYDRTVPYMQYVIRRARVVFRVQNFDHDSRQLSTGDSHITRIIHHPQYYAYSSSPPQYYVYSSRTHPAPPNLVTRAGEDRDAGEIQAQVSP